MVKEQKPLFKALLPKEAKVKYSDGRQVRGVGGKVVPVNEFYLASGRGKRDPLFINHPIINKIIPIEF